jgi:tetratricopeptide (TPR) repeat protein
VRNHLLFHSHIYIAVILLLLAGASPAISAEIEIAAPAIKESMKLSPKQEIAALTKKANAGDVRAQNQLGVMYAEGNGVAKDAAKAMQLFRKAVALGHSDAQYNLGSMYDNGEGVAKDVIKAVEWYQKSAAQGHSDAQFSLALAYAEGKGVPKDAAVAVTWLQKSAAQGHSFAQHYLSLMYALGEGVVLDMVLAHAWSNIAANSGMLEAVENRAILESQLSKVELIEAQKLSSRWKKGQSIFRESTFSSRVPAMDNPILLLELLAGIVILVSTLSMVFRLLSRLRKILPTAFVLMGLSMILGDGSAAVGTSYVVFGIVVQWRFYPVRISCRTLQFW